jgi:hypothetical protein
MRHKSRTIFAALVAVLALSAVIVAPALASGSPSVETKPATSIAETGATLNGAVNPNGAETKYYFEYGTTTKYGSKTAEASAGSGTTNLEESKAITGLTINTTYHFRIVATNSNGTSDGADKEFVATPKAGLPEFVPGPGEGFPIKAEFTSDSTQSFIENTSGNLFVGTCHGVKVKGELTGAKSGSFTIESAHCESGSKECTTVGAAEDHEVLTGSGSLVYINKATKVVGIVLTVNPSEIKCGSTKIKVEGGLNIPVTPLNTATSKVDLSITCRLTGKQQYSSYENEKGEKVNDYFFTNFGTGYLESCLNVSEEIKLTTSKPVTIDA